MASTGATSNQRADGRACSYLGDSRKGWAKGDNPQDYFSLPHQPNGAKMLTAIIETPAGTFKAYDQGDDWQVIGKTCDRWHNQQENPQFREKTYERWHSIWQHDRRASFDRALAAVPQSDQATIYFIKPIDSAGG